MSISVVSSHDVGASGTGLPATLATFTYNNTATNFVYLFAVSSSSTSSRTVSSVSLSDGTNSVNMTITAATVEQGAVSGRRSIWCLHCKPHASWSNGATITPTISISGGTVLLPADGRMYQIASTLGGDALQYDTFAGATETSSALWTSHSITTRDGGLALAIAHSGSSVNTYTDAAAGGFTESTDRTQSVGTGTLAVYHKTITTGGTQNYQCDPTAASPSGNSMLVGFFESGIDLTAVNSGAAMKEGDTGVALVGTGMNSSGADIRIRITTATGTYQNSGGTYSASSATAATFTVPTLTSLPFSQNAAGTGLTTWNLEAIGTATGGNDGSPVAVEVRPQTGWDVVEVAVPDLTAASLLSHLGWTAVATDLIQWEASVVVGSITVAIAVNDDGTYGYTSTYTVGGAAAPLPSFDWDFKAYDSANKLWTSVATVTVSSSDDTSSRLRPSIMHRRRRH